MSKNSPPPRDFLDWIGLRSDPDFGKARPLGLAIGFLLAALLAGAVVSAFAVVFHTVKTGFAGIGSGPSLGAGSLIAALLAAPFLVWGTVIRQRSLDFQKEGHITDRINAAVEMLGAEKVVKREDGERSLPNIEVRIGALLSLERIAQDSTRYDKGRDHVRVMEILCAYIRENAPASGAKNFPLPDWESLPDDATEAEKTDHEMWREASFGDIFSPSNVGDWAHSLPKPREDIQLALSIIGRRSPDQLQIEARWGAGAKADAEWVFDTPCPELPERQADQPLGREVLRAFVKDLQCFNEKLDSYAGYRPDLRQTNLQALDLFRLTLSGAKLQNARMEGANLIQARMEGANLIQARMEGADLSEARMEGANLSETRMERANLSEARMEGAYLGGARMQGADLGGARMEGANLGVARMEGAHLSGARMEGANLSRARMEGANLWQARLEGANLIQARMEGASLFEAQMEGANLVETRMTEADLRHAALQNATVRDLSLADVGLSTEQLNSMFGDASVRLPEGVAPPAHWPDWKLPWGSEHAFYDEWDKWCDTPETYQPPKNPEET